MFGFMSLGDLGATIAAGIHRIPQGIEMVVGIPRSGMIPAYMIGLHRNLPVMDITSFVEGRSAEHGLREIGARGGNLAEVNSILLVDDSISSGRALEEALGRIKTSGYAGKVTTCVAVVAPQRYNAVDLYFCEMPHPRIFEWNAFHHWMVEDACFDLDGVLCVDPTAEQNDDGPRYEEFLRNAPPRFRPTRTIGNIVSARLEKYRDLTEAWLKENGISYKQLHLIDLPSAAERIRTSAHCPHKVGVYRKSGASIFFESEPDQAAQIAHLAGKPVLCTDNMQLYLPGLSVRSASKMARWKISRPLNRIRARVPLLQSLYESLRPPLRK